MDGEQMDLQNREELEILRLENRIEKVVDKCIRHNPQDLIPEIAAEVWAWSIELFNHSRF